MTKHFLLIVFALVTCFISAAQKRDCGTEDYYQYQLARNPSLANDAANFNRKVNALLQEHKLHNILNVTEEVIIPVVVHVVYKNDYDSFSTAQVKMQIARLNEDFHNLHSDFYKIPAGFTAVTGNMNVKFVLAQRDPNNNPTNGIEYLKTSRDFNNALPYDDDFMKKSSTAGLDGWDATKYLNVWVCNTNGALNGYSTKPAFLTQDAELDGVVIATIAFGIGINNNAGTNYGRTLTHEVGHWLGLRHVWADDENLADKCTADDDIGDTPKQAIPNYGLHPPGYIHVSCSNGPKGDMWMNFMDYCDHLNRYLFTADQVVRTRAVLATERSAMLTTDKHLPPIHQMNNTAAFTTNSFTTLAVGKNMNIWAGTNRLGLYKFNGTTWAISSGALDGYRMNGMVNDKNGGIWITQQGSLAGGAYASGGGVHYYPDGSSFTGRRYFSDNATNGLPSRSGRSIFIDTAFVGAEPRVWVSTMNQLDPPNDDPKKGGLGLGLATGSPFFSSITAGLNVAINSGTYTVGGNAAQVFVFAPVNAGSPQIVVYNAATGGLITSYDNTNSGGVLPAGFFARAIYGDVAGNKWVGLASGGVALASNSNVWKSINYPTIFPSGSAVNNNAAAGDRYGNVFIGTTAGLVMFNGTDVNDVINFRLFTTTDGLPSNNVTALAIDSVLGKVVIGTDNGITYWNKDCLMRSCDPVVPKIAATTKNGNWADPTVWNSGQVPDCNTIVMVYHTLTINSNTATCFSIFAVSGSNTNITNNVSITYGMCN